MNRQKEATTLVQAKISQRDHKILKVMAVEQNTTIAAYFRTAVRELVDTKRGKEIARRLQKNNA